MQTKTEANTTLCKQLSDSLPAKKKVSPAIVKYGGESHINCPDPNQVRVNIDQMFILTSSHKITQSLTMHCQ